MKFPTILLLCLAAESHQAVIKLGRERRDVQDWHWNRDQAHCIVCVEVVKTQIDNHHNGSITIIQEAVTQCQDRGTCRSFDYMDTFHGWAPQDAVQAAHHAWSDN
ncbi:hypothetical protein F4804DRAFT_308087 [Jackrogersella minutella]|nr:hypothetical protein F4804DRAFT_308087 [Jackrogersella minutella]